MQEVDDRLLSSIAFPSELLWVQFRHMPLKKKLRLDKFNPFWFFDCRRWFSIEKYYQKSDWNHHGTTIWVSAELQIQSSFN